jgi:hypothetical protein
VIYRQTIGSVDGPPATLIGTDTPVFELLPVASNYLEGNIKITNPSSNLVKAALYYVTIRIQDAGLISEEVTFEIDMRIRLSGGPYNNNGNVFNAAMRVQFFSYNIFGNSSDTNFGNSIPDPFWIDGGGWRYLPATLLKIDNTVPGVQSSEAGYYVYAAGVFNNDYTWRSIHNGHPSSDSLCSVNGIIANEGTINIPFSTEVQKQTLWTDASNPNVPLVKGKATVLSFSTPNNDQVYVNIDTNSVNGLIAKDMAAFITFPQNSPEPDGSGYNAGIRSQISQRIATTVESYNSSTGEIVISSTTAILNDLQDGATIYFFGGNYEDRKPWYFSPGTDLASLRRVQAYFFYSEWNFLKAWRNAGNYFGPYGYLTVGQNPIGGMNPNTSDPGGVELGGVPNFIISGDLDNIAFTIS